MDAARHLDFDEFCEWLLPYSVTDSHSWSDSQTEYDEYVETQIEHIGECYDYQDDPRVAASWVNNALGVLGYIEGLYRGVQNRIFEWDEERRRVVWH